MRTKISFLNRLIPHKLNIFRLISSNIMDENTMNLLSEHKKCVEINEGSARMMYDESEAVFYNKVQVLNRDISTQVIRLFAEKMESERNIKYLKKL